MTNRVGWEPAAILAFMVTSLCACGGMTERAGTGDEGAPDDHVSGTGGMSTDASMAVSGGMTASGGVTGAGGAMASAGDSGIVVNADAGGRCQTVECLCRALETCTPAELEQSPPRGTIGHRICGESNGLCIVTAYFKMGSALRYRCEFQMPTTCNASGIIDVTTCPYETCDVAGGEPCPEDLLSCE